MTATEEIINVPGLNVNGTNQDPALPPDILGKRAEYLERSGATPPPARMVWKEQVHRPEGTAGYDPRLLSKWKLLNAEDLAELPPPRWLIDGFLPESALAEMFGAPSTGKSFIALDWGLSVATGTPWLGHEVQQGDVVYIAAEGQFGIGKRYRAWLQGHECEEAPGFHILPSAVWMLEPKHIATLVKLIRDASVQPRLIVIDTLARCFGDGDENQTKDMNRFVAGCEALLKAFPGTSVLIVHHSGKDKSKGGRGSIALKGAVEAEFEVEKSKGSKDKLTLKNPKQKDAPEAADLHMQLVSLGAGIEDSCVLRALTPAETRQEDAQAKVSAGEKNDRTAFWALMPFGEDGASADEWLKGSKLGRSTFYDSRKRLVDSGRVAKPGSRYVIREISLDDPWLEEAP